MKLKEDKEKEIFACTIAVKMEREMIGENLGFWVAKQAANRYP